MVKSLHHSHQVNQSIYNNYNRDSKKEDEHRRSQKQASNKAKILKKEEEEFKLLIRTDSTNMTKNQNVVVSMPVQVRM